MKVYWLLGLALAGCTKPNPAVCCLDQADCDEVGITEVRDCNPGLACVDHQCEIPSCSMTGCQATMPVCNITTDVCEGCTDSSNCSKFTDTDVCDTGTGACVECVSAADCDAAKPVCDANACRQCRLDSECPSGACGDDGACVAESAIVYLDPGGTNAGTCTRVAPCRTVTFGITQTSSARDHIVLAAGGYVDNVLLMPQSTTATHLYIHGGGAATVSPASDENSTFSLSVPTTVRDLQVVGAVSNSGIQVYNGPHVLERIHFQGGARGLGVTGSVTARDIKIDVAAFQAGVELSSGGSLTMNRAVIRGGSYGIQSPDFGTAVDLTNVLIWGATTRAIELPSTTGTISFSTIADSGTDSGTGPRAVNCYGGLTVRSSIIWAPGTTSRVSIQGCNLVSTIAGPTPVPGAMNNDPLFVNNVAHDYHLASGSLARDAVDSGPPTDFEGDARPQGARFDIGADEAAP